MNSGLNIDLRELLRPGRGEGARLELKKTGDRNCVEAAVKSICAFANDLHNLNGGYVVFGVAEEDGQPVLPPAGLGPTTLDALQKSLRGAINRITPSYVPAIHVEELDGRALVVVWCPPGESRPYQAPAASKGPFSYWVRIGSETIKADDTLRQRLFEAANRTPFDDRACHQASLDDLSPALLQHHLHQVGSKLAGEHHPADFLWKQLGLSTRINGHSVPRNVALLFFANEPARWFQGARIEVAQFPEGKGGQTIHEQTFEGPLPAQLQAALRSIKGFIPHKLQKLPEQAEALEISAWPFAAVEEALVNAVHHRGYDLPDPIKVDILPDRLTIASYPGPMDGVSIEDLQGDSPPPTRSRNRRIAGLLREIHLAEARGTGVFTMRAAMKANGSPPPQFRFDEGRTFFEVTLPTHPAFMKSAESAQPLRIGRPAPASEIVGREDLIERARRILMSQSLLLVGPRGRGASTVLNGLAEAAPSGVDVLHLDVRDVSTGGFVAAARAWLVDAKGVRLDVSDDDPVSAMAAVAQQLATMPLWLVLDHLDQVGADRWDWEDRDLLLDSLLMAFRETASARLILGAERRSNFSGFEAEEKLSTTTRTLHIPPLSQSASHLLAANLLRGAHLGASPDTSEALGDLSRGLPRVLVRLAQQLHIEGVASPEAAQLALDALATEPGDPTGLVGRVNELEALLGRQGGGYTDSPSYQSTRQWPGPTKTRLFNLVAAEPEGVRRLDLIARAVRSTSQRLDVLHAMKELELDGWLVEVDGVIRFEHPWIRDAWVAAAAAPPAASVPGADDLPF